MDNINYFDYTVFLYIWQWKSLLRLHNIFYLKYATIRSTILL